MLILGDDAETSSVPTVNTLLIVINALVFLWCAFCVSNMSEFFGSWGTVPTRFISQHDLHDFTAIVTSMFLHGGFLHLLGNMWALFIFGDNVEDRLGHLTYLLFYLACGFAADLAHVFANAGSPVPCVGASGAIAGVMGAYLLLHPHAKCKTWWGDYSMIFAFRTYEVPAYIIILGWFVIQIFMSTFIPVEASNVAFGAHIGGFAAGMLLLGFLNLFRREPLGKANDRPSDSKRLNLEEYSSSSRLAYGLVFVVLIVAIVFTRFAPPNTGLTGTKQDKTVVLKPSTSRTSKNKKVSARKKKSNTRQRHTAYHHRSSHKNRKDPVVHRRQELREKMLESNRVI